MYTRNLIPAADYRFMHLLKSSSDADSRPLSIPKANAFFSFLSFTSSSVLVLLNHLPHSVV